LSSYTSRNFYLFWRGTPIHHPANPTDFPAAALATSPFFLLPSARMPSNFDQAFEQVKLLAETVNADFCFCLAPNFQIPTLY
jgi:hypothetical protein